MLQTDRLALRPFERSDAPFILELLNDPDWIRFIGDRHVHSLADAEAYLENGPIAMARKHGFALWHVSERDEGQPVGMCGLLRRPSLPDADLGFASLARYRRRGYAREAASAVLHYADTVLALPRVLAICDPQNVASIALLRQLGFVSGGQTRLPGETLDLHLLCRARGGEPASLG